MMIRSQTVIMIIVLMVFAFTSVFIFPQADDFHYIIRTAEKGYLPSLVYEYMNWTGRYTTILFHYYSPLYWGTLAIYRIFPVILLGLMYLSSVFLVKQIYASKLKPGEGRFFGLAITYLCVTGFHTISEGLYWFASAYTYTISIVIFNYAFGLLYAEIKSPAKSTGAFIIGFILSGTNETSMVLWLYALGVMGIIHWIDEKKIPKALLATFIISLIGALIVLKAPGNAVRASQFPKSHDLVRTISNALLYSFIDPFKFLTIPLVAFTLLNWRRITEVINIGSWDKKKKLVVLFMMGLFFVSFAPSLWGMGRRPNPRTMNVIVHLYILMFFPVVLALFKERIREQTRFRYAVIALAFSMPTFYLLQDFSSGAVAKYAEQWKQNIDSRGKVYFSKSEAARTLHFDFVEEESNGPFKEFMDLNPNFYR